MTEHEAMEIIMQVAYDVEFPNNSNEAFGIACKCIEKQIPMKPQEINEEEVRLNGIWNWSCGKCGRFHRNDYPLNYCNECGQKVDWSKYE